ncbi:hypothetical protein C7447_103397 [Tenacibaculum adriaticum]|uniref:Esterase n=1 Tax=Tenacibaculum adriaticum TaxID=413713 RepID=A0A5S5DT96_9FLAO|nr:alpha/beta hydrolase-fold protein [Tenacibaculum adriaticum]TYP98226.1 hypothetical protein C7447_103397 [Tenacibaculum adriaticum]
MKKIHTLIAILIFTLSYSQTIIEKKINSLEFNKERTLKIHLPEGYETDTVQKYPLAIVLNNGYLFDLYVGNSTVFAAADLAPKQIIVGLDVDNSVNKDVSTIEANGDLTENGKKFYDYIKKEVLPYLETNLKTSPFLTIAGEGSAGNFVTHFLKEEKPIFNAYIAISPIFNQNTPNFFAAYNLKRLDDIDNQFYLYISNNRQDSREEKRIYSLLEKGLQALDNQKLHTTFDNFEKSPNVPTAISAAIPNALTQVFELYPRISKEEFETKIKDLDPLDAIKYVETKYLDIEYIFGTNMNVRLEDIFAIEGIVIDRQDGDYLRVLGDFVMIKHPNSHIGDYYVGKFHELGKDYEKALFFYKEAYGKMKPSDPNAEAFYENLLRVQKAYEKTKIENEQSNPEETPLEPDDEDTEDEDDGE